MTALVREPRRGAAALVAGAGLAVWFLVRNEAILATTALLATLLLAWRGAVHVSTCARCP